MSAGSKYSQDALNFISNMDCFEDIIVYLLNINTQTIQNKIKIKIQVRYTLAKIILLHRCINNDISKNFMVFR